jgi:sRNA-binding protein
VSPQFHIVHDDLFTTVPNAETGGLLQPVNVTEQRWRHLLESGYEDYVDAEGNDGDELNEEWLTGAERDLREERRRLQRERRIELFREITRPYPRGVQPVEMQERQQQAITEAPLPATTVLPQIFTPAAESDDELENNNTHPQPDVEPDVEPVVHPQVVRFVEPIVQEQEQNQVTR